MLKAWPLGEWTPDLAPSNSTHLAQAINVRPIANGYAPAKAFEGITPTFTGGQFLGGGAFLASDGTATLLAANEAGVDKYVGGAWGGVVSFPQTLPNHFAQFGDNVIISANAAAKPYSYDLIAGTATLISAAPYLVDVAQVRDFVMGITTDNTVRWSEFNDSASWTIGTNQADEQPILSSFGVRLVGGEYGLLLKKQGITRITYVGSANDIIFQFDDFAPEIGCMAAGSVCNIGRLVFFLSERGFELCDGAEVLPISDEKINRWFFGTYSRAEIELVTSAIDPRTSEAVWCMPGAPGRLICYNWVLKRWSVRELAVSGIFTGFTVSVTLESLDADYPSLDAMTLSLDDPSFAGGNPQLLLVDTDNVVGALTGANLEATLETKNIEPVPGKRSRIRDVRLVSDVTEASARFNSRQRIGDAEAFHSAASLRASGRMPVRCNGRFHDVEITIPAGTDWTFIQAFELEFEPGGMR